MNEPNPNPNTVPASHPIVRAYLAALGRKGGKALASKMSPEQRAANGRKGAMLGGRKRKDGQPRKVRKHGND